MKALILAAGMGSRVAELSDEKPKSLIEVCGVPLIERIISTVREAGVSEIVVVTGFAKDRLPEALGDGSRMGVSIEYCFNDRWDGLANGYSIYSARELLPPEFLILMSDHLFTKSCLDKMLSTPAPKSGCRLLTDPRIDDCFDIDDATKVRADEDGRIVEMGKALTNYNQLDTGIFYSTHGLIEALERNLEEGKSSLTDANNELARRGLMLAEPLEGSEHIWLDIDTPAGLKEAERLIAAGRL